MGAAAAVAGLSRLAAMAFAAFAALSFFADSSWTATSYVRFPLPLAAENSTHGVVGRIIGALTNGCFRAKTGLLLIFGGDNTATNRAADQPAFDSQPRYSHRTIVKADGKSETGGISAAFVLQALQGESEAAAHAACAQRHVTNGFLRVSGLRRAFNCQPMDTIADEPHRPPLARLAA
jgi:hypothetical protein